MAEKKLNREDREKIRMRELLRILKREYPEAECSLNFRNPFELLIATILSAQCTDIRVNLVTPALFKRFPTPAAMALAKREEIEELIQSTGFFRAKARSLQEASQSIVKDFGGKVPQDLDSLIQLRGVGRKTANVVLGVIYSVPSLVVDTHVKRLTYRLGFTESKDPKKIEQEMMKIVSQGDWTLFAHLLIFHGRSVCTAKRPKCPTCPVEHLCPKIDVRF